MNKRNLVVLSGAGLSAESGLQTFRDNNGLWEQHRVEDVATPEAWHQNMDLVLRFYNERRAQLETVQPNSAHISIASLEQDWNVQIITQNVDDLHERGGSSSITHLHGELTKARSTGSDQLVYDIGYSAINKKDMCPKGFQLRPHIVWFGEEVPKIGLAQMIVSKADVVLVIGTSLKVYPAAGLVHACQSNTPIIIVDPNPEMKEFEGGEFTVINEKATIGMTMVAKLLKDL